MPHSRPAITAVAVLAVLGLLLTACGSKSRPTLAAPSSSVKPTASTLPTTCAPLGPGESLVATASTPGSLDVYGQPGDASPSTTMANPFLVNGDPKAPVPLTFLVKDFPVAQRCQWLQVYLPVRPNGSTGWVKATDVSHVSDPYRIEADLAEFVLKVFKDDQQTDSIKIGVARSNTPTPGGVYYLTELIKSTDPTYGPYAYGLSGYSDTLQSFNGGPGQLGIHGTNQPQYLGTQVSHGCIRMSNDDITRLAHELPLGTPVQINA